MDIPDATIALTLSLKRHNIDPILYGSQGVALHIGRFKEFGDIDFLIGDEWIDEKWNSLISIMGSLGFKMVNKHEHEFENNEKTAVGFASESILVRDGITIPGGDDIVSINVGGVLVRTLSIEAFRRAYEFSVRDGYRIETRGKKDQDVLRRLGNL